MELNFFSPRGEREEKEQVRNPLSQITSKHGDNFSCSQYYDYDFNSSIADVGAFLGLLLGHRIYSFYQVAADWMNKMNISRSSKARKRSYAKLVPKMKQI